jgi:alkanesulfonate monooxygenase SsuD/methylene tetrahydromethanopterin reductase-like flavin-dependent oxidoreductase (luciferase family)
MAKLGIMIEGQEGLTWEKWRRLCLETDELGFDALRRSDHLFSVMGVEGRECIDTWASLGLAAEWTRRIQIGVMVSPMTFYEPAVLARMAASVDQLSEGRLILGVGAGWNQLEHERYEVPFLTLRERMDRLENSVRIIRKAWAISATRPVQDPVPLLMGAQGEKRALPLVAREAAEWNLSRLDSEIYSQKWSVLEGCCRDIGRDPDQLRRSIMCGYLVGRNQDELLERAAAVREVIPRLAGMEPAAVLEQQSRLWLVGTPNQIVTRIGDFSRLGVDLFMLQHFLLDDSEALRLLAEEVIPAIR